MAALCQVVLICVPGDIDMDFICFWILSDVVMNTMYMDSLGYLDKEYM